MSERRQPARGPVVRLAWRLGGHSATYLFASGAVFVAGLLSVAVYTRFLDPAEFGELALLLVLAQTLTVLYNAGSLQGTISWAYGSGGDEDGDDDSLGARAADAPRALTTGLLMTAALSTVGLLVVIVLAHPLIRAVVGSDDDAALIILAAGSAGFAALYRIAVNAIRYERRAMHYAAIMALQGLLPTLVSIPLLVAGLGTEGVLVGIVIGNGVAASVAVGTLGRSLAFRASRRDARMIIRRGAPMLPVVASNAVVNVLDLILLSGFVSNPEVGLYRVAARMGGMVSHFTGAFNSAWGPLRRDLLHVAADADRGRQKMSALLATWYLAGLGALLLAFTLFAGVLIHVAGPQFSSAAYLLPWVAAAAATHAIFILVYRTADFPHKRPIWIGLSVAASVSFVLLLVVLVPAIGSEGVPIAAIIAWSAGTTAMVIFDLRAAPRTPYEWRNLLQIGVAGGAVAAVVCLSTPSSGALRVVTSLIGLGVYAGTLIARGILPWRHVRSFASYGVAAAARGRRSTNVSQAVAAIPAADLAVVDLMLRCDMSTERVARQSGMPEDVVVHRFGEALHQIAFEEPAGDSVNRDHLSDLVRVVTASGPFAERDDALRRLVATGADPIWIDHLARAAAGLGAQHRRNWSRRRSWRRGVGPPNYATSDRGPEAHER